MVSASGKSFRQRGGEPPRAVGVANRHGQWGASTGNWVGNACAPWRCDNARGHDSAKMRATRGYWGLGRRALRGYGWRTETPPAKLSACANCHATHRADGAAARWGHRALPQRGTGSAHGNGARVVRTAEGCAARERGEGEILNTKEHKERRDGMYRDTKARRPGSQRRAATGNGVANRHGRWGWRTPTGDGEVPAAGWGRCAV